MHTPWIRETPRCPQPQLRLFCFPYAGAGASIFRTWADKLPAGVQLCRVQLPGREDRLKEKPFLDLLTLVWALADALDPYLKALPYVFYGHSMGSLICFELARELRRRQANIPLRLYISGHTAPQLHDAKPPIHKLPDSEFIAELCRLEGTPKEVWKNRELTQLLLPTLRADFAIDETYIYTYQRPLKCPILAFGGRDDVEVSRLELEAWRAQTESTFQVWMLPGNHFFIHGARDQLLERLAVDLNQLLL